MARTYKQKILGFTNAKTQKGEEKFDVYTGIVYFAPARISGREMCSHRSEGCTAACLYTAGRGTMTVNQNARVKKTQRFLEDRAGFMAQLDHEITLMKGRAVLKGMKPAIRLNGTSDLPWENIRFDDGTNIMERHPDVEFYDYTKNYTRNVERIPNYHLTFSRSETNESKIPLAIANGMNVAVVFSGDLPETYMGLPVIDGDESDVRFNDPTPCVVGLKAKGRARKDASGFVVHT